MRFFPIPMLLLALAIVPALGQEEIAFQVRSAVFSKDQTFWPGLASGGQPALRKAEASKPKKSGPRQFAVLPIRIKDRDWKETLPCDSCHRLSANGMEFFLENYFAQKLRMRFEKDGVDLIAPHSPFLQTAKIDLLDYQDSLDLPWSRWFDGYTQDLIYRPREWMAAAETRKRLDRLGGLVGATHLLLPAKVWFKVDSKASNLHHGNLEWGFHLVFWNVGAGRAEWAMAFTETARNVDLDAPLDARLDRSLVAAWDRMPSDLAALWKAEQY